MIKDFVKQIKSKSIFVASLKEDKLKIVKQGINDFKVFFISKENKNNWCINCSIRAISLILEAWENDKKLIKKSHTFEW